MPIMTNNGARNADDEADTTQKKRRESQRGGEASRSLRASGADGRQRDSREENEETPLLATEATNGHATEDRPRRHSEYRPWDEFADLPWWKKPHSYWLLAPFILSALAFGGIIVPKINLILNLICHEYYADKSIQDPNFTLLPISWTGENPQCRSPEVQQKVAAFTLQGSLISGILAAIIAPKLGALSDRYGRKPIMCVTNFGMFTGEILTILAAKYPETFPVRWMLLGYFFDGLCGSFIASMAMSHSYAADSTPPKSRNVIFGYFHGCLFTGIALGPLLAAYIIKVTGTVIAMFYIALGCHIFFIVFLVLFIPESLSKSRQQAARERHKAAVLARGPSSDWIQQIYAFNLFEPLKILYPKGPHIDPEIRRNLLLLASVDMIIFGVAMGAITVVIIYSQFIFGWTASQQSIFMSVVNSSRVFCLLAVLPALTRLYRGKAGRRQSQPDTGADVFELSVMRAGILFDMVGFLGYTLARTSPLFMLSGAVASFGGMGSPTLQAALTKHVPPGQVGQLLGAMGLLHSFARIIAPTVFNLIYIATVESFPQTVFVILTAMFGMAFGVSWFVKPGLKLVEDPDDESSYQRRFRPVPEEVEDVLAI
ncbi:tetracycline-efflux transporter-like protein [Venturia nashicola]|uniref:Tetracycline-efflux transporter-like protein n=1 Tax=Venturia nashicola TaxID=86259 RepID=A0A4Z1NU76_9PEZI|nr:tetracycline-efflux transporter-like protein [Venturia nashicola]TLD20844.1 tetracycline-efflux transporter-like protein [Venturia nashicola]